MNDKVVTNVKNEVMNISGANRAFYRIFILPQHIERREGEMKAVLQEELKRHKKFVKDNNLQEELDKYIAAQEDRQAKYDALQVVKGEFAEALGQQNHPEMTFRRLADLEDKVKAAEEAFEESRDFFKATYH